MTYAYTLIQFIYLNINDPYIEDFKNHILPADSMRILFFSQRQQEIASILNKKLQVLVK